MTARRTAIYAVNTVLVLTIVGLIGATWLPAIYVSPWFQHNAWVRAHLLDAPPTATPKPAERPGRR